MDEIVLTRIFSVTMWYHFAFVAISVALFGMTVGALIVHLLPDRFPSALLTSRLWLFSLLFSVAIALSFTVELAIPFYPRWTAPGIASVMATCVVISIPFVFSGVVVCLALTRFPAQVNRLYGADLVGAAFGGALLVVVLQYLDGPSAVIAIAALAGFAAWFFAWDARVDNAMLLAAGAVIIFGAFAAFNGYRSVNHSPLLRIFWAKGERDPVHGYERWNAFSRITVDGDPNAVVPAQGWGLSKTLPPTAQARQLAMTIDGVALTWLTKFSGNPDELAHLRYDVTNIGHYLRHDADVLVVGVGGGRDVDSALVFGQRSVTGVEINQRVLDVTNGEFGDFTGHLDRDPRVTFVNDEARSYLTRTNKKYDIIQISLIDTWAAGAAGAYALSENSLYTTEAWKVFLNRLKPGGILSVSRWYDARLETFRTASLAAQVLKDRGVAEPRKQMVIVASANPMHNVATVLVSSTPFSDADIATLRAEVARLQFTTLLDPDTAAEPFFADIASPAGPAAAIHSLPEDISPPSDDRPFFFQMLSARSFFNGSAYQNAWAARPMLVLAVLSLVVLAMTALCIVLPLLVTTRREAHRGMTSCYVYFAAIGLGFLLLEVSQLQRLSIFLGHPTYALTVVLFSLLVSSGLGSMLSEAVARPARPVSLLLPLAALISAIVLFGAITPAVIHSAAGQTTRVRILVAVGLLMPLGLIMGMPFPIGMRAAASRPLAPTAFLWGINGATSVCASVVGMLIALLWGISAAFWTGAFAYAAALIAMTVIVAPMLRRGSPPENGRAAGGQPPTAAVSD